MGGAGFAVKVGTCGCPGLVPIIPRLFLASRRIQTTRQVVRVLVLSSSSLTIFILKKALFQSPGPTPKPMSVTRHPVYPSSPPSSMLGPRRNGHARPGHVVAVTAGLLATCLLFSLPLQTAAGQCCSTVQISGNVGTGGMGGHFQQITPSDASGMPS